MKKNIIILLLLFSTCLYGQEGRFGLGLYSGPNLSKPVDKDDLYAPALSFSSGLSFSVDITEEWSLLSGAEIIRKRFFDVWNEIRDGEIKSDFICIPLTAKYAYGARVRYYVLAGVEFGLLLESEEIIYDWPVYIRDYAEYLNKLDVGIKSGIGVSAALNNRISINMEVNNIYGLKNMSADSYVTYGPLKFTSFRLIAGLYVKL